MKIQVIKKGNAKVKTMRFVPVCRRLSAGGRKEGLVGTGRGTGFLPDFIQFFRGSADMKIVVVKKAGVLKVMSVCPFVVDVPPEAAKSETR